MYKRQDYNVNQSKIAIGSGGFWGKGFLEGTQIKYGFVPERHTDFIFCTVGEEWGFLGTMVVLAPVSYTHLADVDAPPHAVDDRFEVLGIDLGIVAFVKTAVERILPLALLDDMRNVVVAPVGDDGRDIGQLQGRTAQRIPVSYTHLVICTDKTGTWTQNRMHVQELVRYDSLPAHDFAEIVAANSTAFLDASGAVIGNPTEGALLEWMRSQGEDYEPDVYKRQSPDLAQISTRAA